MTDHLLRSLISYDWPGNVRELSNVADRFVLGLLDGRFGAAAEDDAHSRSLKDIVSDFERGLIAESLRRNRGDVVAVSEALGLPKKTLYDKMQRYALAADEFR